jgi:type I restriction enzyme S subunit
MKRIFLTESFGGAQPNISQKTLHEVRIPLPPLPEQRHIASCIDEISTRHDVLRQLQVGTKAELDALSRSILNEILDLKV